MPHEAAAYKNITIKLPKNVADMVSVQEIITLLADKSLNKAEYYRSKCQKMEQKYRTDFAGFKKKVEESGEEIFSDWDDLMVWEGYCLGYKEWSRRYEELKNCII